jgi:hypothetical protein
MRAGSREIESHPASAGLASACRALELYARLALRAKA